MPTTEERLGALETSQSEILSVVKAISTRLEEMDAKAEHRFKQIDKRFERVEGRLSAVEGRLNSVEGGLRTLNTRVGALEGQVGELCTRFDAFEATAEARHKQLVRMQQVCIDEISEHNRWHAAQERAN